MRNEHTLRLFQSAKATADRDRTVPTTIDGAEILDAGIATSGSINAGILLARLCMADCAEIQIVPADANTLVSDQAVHVRTDDPLVACLGAQYAGWPVQTDDFFAMGSGPMRMLRGKEEVLTELELSDVSSEVVGVLESDKLPTSAAIETIATQCGVKSSGVQLSDRA